MMKNVLTFVLGLGLLISSDAFANKLTPYPCVLRLMKTDCWKGRQVTVQPIDANTQKPVGPPIVLDKDTYYAMTPIVGCQPLENLSFQATFSPPVWEDSNNAVYPSNQFWQAPAVLPAHANKWIVTMCFANDFSSVPLPLEAGSSCTCTFPALDDTTASFSEAIGRQ